MTDTAQHDARYLALAIRLGQRGLGNVWPNPAVGCVLVRGGVIVGRGVTAPGGRPHAERIALDQAGDAALGATAYVSLEPCSHHGKTPPCTQSLIAAGVARVVCPISDPDPRVAGKGIDALRAAGITVDVGGFAVEASRAQTGFLSRITRGRPMLTLKLASSLDGRIATASGDSQWITGPLARRRVHAMRARHDAVMVGAGTARTDDPSLTVRGLGVVRQPLRIAVSRNLDIPVDSVLVRTARQSPVWFCHGAQAPQDRRSRLEDAGVRLIEVPAGPDRRLAPPAILSRLGQEGLTRIFCEGGGAFAASLISADVVDEMIVFQAGIALGAEGMPSVGALGLDRLADARRFDLVRAETLDGDVCQHWRRVPA